MVAVAHGKCDATEWADVRCAPITIRPACLYGTSLNAVIVNPSVVYSCAPSHMMAVAQRHSACRLVLHTTVLQEVATNEVTVDLPLEAVQGLHFL